MLGAGTYAVGLLLGFVMHKCKGRVRWNAYKSFVVFLGAMALQWAAIFGCYQFSRTGTFERQ